MMETQTHDWKKIEETLQAPFPPKAIRFRLQGPPREMEGKLSVRAIPYVSAHAVQSRLDEAVGAEGWAFRWTPVSVVKGRVMTVKGALSLCGRPPKEEIGRDNGGLEAGETVASDALRNCAGLWGVGRYLAELEALWVEVDSADPKRWAISESDNARLRARLPNAVSQEALPAVAPESASASLPEIAQEAEQPAPGAAAPASMPMPAPAASDLARIPDAAEEAGVDVSEAAPRAAAQAEEKTAAPAASDKIKAVQALCRKLEKAEPTDLEEMPATKVEELLQSLVREWGAAQAQKRAASAQKQPPPQLAAPHSDRRDPTQSKAGQVKLVPDEAWTTLVQLHTEVHGHEPDAKLRSRLPEAIADRMIQELLRLKGRSPQLQTAQAGLVIR